MFMATKKTYGVEEVGTLKLSQVPKSEISSGDVGYLITGIKDAKDVKVGDTIVDSKAKEIEAVSGFEEVKPMVFAGIYPVDTDDYEDLRSSIEKLQLNDASLVFSPENSSALGFGFRCGFLGMLHMEIVQERLEREYGLDLITSAPTVVYEIQLKSGEEIKIDNPSQLPEASMVAAMREPIARANILVPSEYLGNVIALCVERRGAQKDMQRRDAERRKQLIESKERIKELELALESQKQEWIKKNDDVRILI